MGRLRRLIKKIVRPFKKRSPSLAPGSGAVEKASLPLSPSPVLYDTESPIAETGPPFTESALPIGERDIVESSLAKPSPAEPDLVEQATSPSEESARLPESTESQLQPAIPEYEPFKHIPIDLFLAIANSLPLSSTASLTLTCRSAWNILGRHCADLLQGSGRRWRLDFLHLLERDMPRHIVCKECQTLHSRTQNQINEMTPCKKGDYDKYLTLYIHPQFDSITFRLAMKLHHSGLDNSAELARLSPSDVVPHKDHIKHWEVTPRIVNGQYLIRLRTQFIFPVGIKENTERGVTADLCVCPAIYTAPSHAAVLAYQKTNRPVAWLGQPTWLHKILTCRANHWNDAQQSSNCGICAGLYQCVNCPTEFQVDSKGFGEHGVMMIITQWLDLGDGKDATDEMFTSHGFIHNGGPVNIPPGSIKAAFERANPDTENPLTPLEIIEIVRARFKGTGIPIDLISVPPVPNVPEAKTGKTTSDASVPAPALVSEDPEGGVQMAETG